MVRRADREWRQAWSVGAACVGADTVKTRDFLFAAQYSNFHSSSPKRREQGDSGASRAASVLFSVITAIIECIRINDVVLPTLRSRGFSMTHPLFSA
jgi:hypothetical protein